MLISSATNVLCMYIKNIKYRGRRPFLVEERNITRVVAFAIPEINPTWLPSGTHPRSCILVHQAAGTLIRRISISRTSPAETPHFLAPNRPARIVVATILIIIVMLHVQMYLFNNELALLVLLTSFKRTLVRPPNELVATLAVQIADGVKAGDQYSIFCWSQGDIDARVE
jgi:hypothetical protein